MEERRHIRFYGHVQGVGFRYTASHLARSLSLTGWVRNEWDGTVTMEVQGRPALIDELLVKIKGRYISVFWMDIKELPLEENEHGFSVRG